MKRRRLDSNIWRRRSGELVFAAILKNAGSQPPQLDSYKGSSVFGGPLNGGGCPLLRRGFSLRLLGDARQDAGQAPCRLGNRRYADIACVRRPVVGALSLLSIANSRSTERDCFGDQSQRIKPVEWRTLPRLAFSTLRHHRATRLQLIDAFHRYACCRFMGFSSICQVSVSHPGAEFSPGPAIFPLWPLPPRPF